MTQILMNMDGQEGILLQQGNAAILGNRVPALPGAHVDGILQSVTSFQTFHQVYAISTVSPWVIQIGIN